MSSCILFLDFDGVTHPEPCFPENVFCRLPLIEKVLFDFPTVAIVISSSWRDHYTMEGLRDFFSQGIKSRVIGATNSIKRPGPDWLPGFVPKFERQWECESWLKANRPWGTPWMAIDDREYWFEPDSPHLLLTDSKLGFWTEDQNTLRQMLQERTT